MASKPPLTESAAFHIEMFQTLFSGEPLRLQDIVIFCRLRGVDDFEKTILILKELERFEMSKQTEDLKNGRATRRNN